VIVSKIYAHARQTPDRTALVFNNNRLSYRRFAELIDASRRYLVAQELPGDGVAVLVIASILDAWIQGLALRSLGLTTVIVRSPDEIDRLGLSDISCVVTTEAERRADVEAACTRARRRFIRVPRAVYADATAGAALKMSDLPGSLGGHILLTSGTTGIYKKILHDPAVEAALFKFRQQLFEISRRSIVNGFNFGGWTGVGYLIGTSTWDVGGRVILYQGPNKYESFRYGGITQAFLVPGMLTELLGAPASALRRDDRMRLFVTGGPLSQVAVQEARARLTSRIYTYVGCTEASVFALTPIEQAEDLRWHRLVASRKVEIVDDGDRPVPAGQMGLVRVDTFGGVEGYFRDEETSRAFFRDGYFYPGDLGVIGADGRLALDGRVTDVVNVLGSKFAAGPIEDALQRQLGVAGVCVFSMPDEAGEEIIHVAIESPRPLSQTEVVAALAEALPGTYPTRIHVSDMLPRNSMGKIQRDELRQRLRMPAP
jgi:acyl-coenzyme A synthetase/AMP-(fatty) acid ligase